MSQVPSVANNPFGGAAPPLMPPSILDSLKGQDPCGFDPNQTYMSAAPPVPPAPCETCSGAAEPETAEPKEPKEEESWQEKWAKRLDYTSLGLSTAALGSAVAAGVTSETIVGGIGFGAAAVVLDVASTVTGFASDCLEGHPILGVGKAVFAIFAGRAAAKGTMKALEKWGPEAVETAGKLVKRLIPEIKEEGEALEEVAKYAEDRAADGIKSLIKKVCGSCSGGGAAPPDDPADGAPGTTEPLPPEVERQMYTPVGDGLEVENWDAFR